MNNEITTTGNNPIAVLKSYLDNDSVKKRFNEMLGKRSGAFINSIVNVTAGNDKLRACTPASICSGAVRAATFNLPIDPALGQAALVPYGGVAVFQLMYKGLTQLCIRSGKYATIHCAEVYADEIKSHNPITGEVYFNNPDTYKMRYQDDRDKLVVGHYAYFKLLSGFEKSDYMPTAEALAHGKKYSKAYQYDLKKGKQASPWSTDPIVMCNKTVLIRLLSKYGVMSIEMQDALIGEREGFDSAASNQAGVVKDEQGSEVIDAELEPKDETPAEENEEIPDWMKTDN